MARGRVFQKERRRGRPWSYVVDAGPGLDGRRLQRKRGGFRIRVDAERALREYLSDRDAGRPTAGRSERRLGEWLAEWLDTKAGRLHDGRHTAATLALQGGAHPKLVQEMLGHASIEMTLDTYSHVVPGMHREVADRIEQVLAPTVDEPE